MAQWIEHQTSNLGVAGSSPARGMITFSQPSLAVRSGSLVVMTSALHAEGREFNPRPEYFFFSAWSTALRTRHIEGLHPHLHVTTWPSG